MSDAVGAAFARLAQRTDEEALEAAARAVTERAVEVLDELSGRFGSDGFWRDRIWRTVEAIHGFRAAGRITDVDEVYRIWAVAERFAEHARAVTELDDDARQALRARHDELLFEVAGATPAGAPLPEGPDVDATVLAGGTLRPLDRVAEAVDAWETVLADDEEARAIAEQRLSIDEEERGRSLRVIEWAAEAGLISDVEHGRMLEALGTRHARGGWPEGTPTALKGAVQELLGSLHSLFGARDR